MKLFSLHLDTVILRFYAIMAVVILGGFIGQYWIMALALPIFLSAMLGVTFETKKKESVSVSKNLQQNRSTAKAA